MKTEVVLGIDIGGTNTVFGFVDKEGKQIAESSVPTNRDEYASFLFARLFAKVKDIYQGISGKYTLIGIGIGAPNANYYKGTVELPPNLNWGVVNILEIVKQYYDLPAAITNDANAAAIGEMEFGAAKGMKNFIVITLGTGVGSGIVVDGKLVYGHDGFAGEIGHSTVFLNGRQCGCGKKGCLEAYTSASGIKRTYYELLSNSREESVLCKIAFDDLNSIMIYEAAMNGDKIALETFEYTAKILAVKLADAVAHTSPEAIFLYGGIATAGDLLFTPTKKYMDEYLLGIFKNKVKLLPSGLKNGETAVLGASALIWNELKNKN
jgi:glucokinase